MFFKEGALLEHAIWFNAEKKYLFKYANHARTICY